MQINKNNQPKGNMSRIRLNSEYRNKIANRMRVHLEQEDTQEKKKYDAQMLKEHASKSKEKKKKTCCIA